MYISTDYSEFTNFDKNLAFLWGEGKGFVELYLQLHAHNRLTLITLMTSSTWF